MVIIILFEEFLKIISLFIVFIKFDVVFSTSKVIQETLNIVNRVIWELHELYMDLAFIDSVKKFLI